MEGITANVTFDPKTPEGKRRVTDAQIYELLTSQAVNVLGMLAFLALVISSVGWFFLAQENDSLLGIALLAGVTWTSWLMMFIFASTYYPHRRPVTPPSQLLAETNKISNAIEAADFALVRTLKHIQPQTKDAVGHIVTAAFTHTSVKNMFDRFELSANEALGQVYAQVLPLMTYNDLWFNALNTATQANQSAVRLMNVVAACLLHPGMQPYLRQKNLRPEDIMFATWWQNMMTEQKNIRSRWWTKERLQAFSGLGLSWAAGFTPLLDRFSYFPVGNVWDIALGHDDEVDSLINSLARKRQSNVLLVGQPGTGRLGVVREAARRIEHNQAHPALYGQRLVYVHLGQLAGLGSSVPQQMELISRILDEMERSGNIIAVLDGLGSLLEASAGGANMSDILVPFFASQTVRVIVIMSNDEYHLRLKANEEIGTLFEVVQVEPLLPETTMQLLAFVLPAWEEERGVAIPYQTMREVVDVSSSILPQVPFPEKAFDLLEEITVEGIGNKQTRLTVDDVHRVVTRKIGVPVGKVKGEEATHLLHLEDYIHQRVVNQETAVTAVSRAMVRARAGVRNTSRPIGTFLFLGPTGVGKTETAKALAEAYFGAEEYLQRLDMSEYQTADSTERLIGSFERPNGQLTALISDQPFCVLLLDEFEKAHRAVQQLFLQVFDEARLTDARGRTYSFKHSILIATSNAGAEFIRQTVTAEGSIPPHFDANVREYILQEGIFRPELLNRFDGVITFTPLSPAHIKEVAKRMLRKLNKRLDREHGITITVNEELLGFLGEIGYNADFGARPMARAIQDTVEYAVAEQVLKGQTTAGKTITLNTSYLRTLVR